MGNEFFSPGEQRASQVNKLFATIAPHYDLLMMCKVSAASAMESRLVTCAAPQPGERADVCCGTGDLAFALAAAERKWSG
jgi:ubiquinone/menaquinone biosynthesis C-methylase UbiE